MSSVLDERAVVEIPDDDNLLHETHENEDLGERTEEESDPNVPKGARSLMNICQGIMMRCQTRYDDVGYLMYVQHPLFFDTLGVDQLREIEGNSPSLKPETDHLWRKFAARMDPANGANFKDEDTKSWRKAYRVFEKVEARRRAASALAARQMYMQEEEAKKARSIKLVDDVVGSKGGGRSVGGSWGGPPKTPLGQIRGKTALERQKRSLPIAPSATDRLVKSTSTASTSGTASVSSLFASTSSKFKPTGSAKLPSASSCSSSSGLTAMPTIHTAGMNVRRFGPDLEALTAPETHSGSRHRVYERPPVPIPRAVQRKDSGERRLEQPSSARVSSTSFSTVSLDSGGNTSQYGQNNKTGSGTRVERRGSVRVVNDNAEGHGTNASGPRTPSTRTSSSSPTSASSSAGPSNLHRRKRKRETSSDDDGSDVELLHYGPTGHPPVKSAHAQLGHHPPPGRRAGIPSHQGSSMDDAIPLIDIDDSLPPQTTSSSTSGRLDSLRSTPVSRIDSALSPTGGIGANSGPIKGFGQAWRTADSSLFIPKPKRKKVG